MLKILDWIRNDWKNNRTVFILESINLFANATQSLYVTIFVPSVNWWIVYTLYMTGSVAGILFSIKRKTMPLLILNVFFTISNVIGLAKLLINFFSR